MKKILFSLLTIIFFLQNANASSPQVPDYIIFKGDTIPVYNLLVEKYFDNIKKSDNGELFGLKFREGLQHFVGEDTKLFMKLITTVYSSNILFIVENYLMEMKLT